MTLVLVWYDHKWITLWDVCYTNLVAGEVLALEMLSIKLQNILKENLFILICCTELYIWGSNKIMQWILSFWSALPAGQIKLQNSSKCYNSRSNSWIILTFCIKNFWKDSSSWHFWIEFTRQADHIISFFSLPGEGSF